MPGLLGKKEAFIILFSHYAAENSSITGVVSIMLGAWKAFDGQKCLRRRQFPATCSSRTTEFWHDRAIGCDFSISYLPLHTDSSSNKYIPQSFLIFRWLRLVIHIPKLSSPSSALNFACALILGSLVGIRQKKCFLPFMSLMCWVWEQRQLQLFIAWEMLLPRKYSWGWGLLSLSLFVLQEHRKGLRAPEKIWSTLFRRVTVQHLDSHS